MTKLDQSKAFGRESQSFSSEEVRERTTFVDKTVEEIGRGTELVIPIVQAIQEHYRYLPQEALQRVCEISEITPAQITGVSTFYTQFRLRPAGQHTIHVCVGTACHVKGANSVYDAFFNHLGISEGEDTDADGLFTIEKVACLGCCTLAPAIRIDDVTYGHLTPDIVPRVLRDFLELEARGIIQHSGEHSAKIEEGYGEIRISLDSCCIAKGSAKVYEALERAVAETGARAVVKSVGCTGMSHLTPLVEVVEGRESGKGKVKREKWLRSEGVKGRAGKPENQNTQHATLYARVQPEDAKSIVLRHFKPRGVVRKISNVVSKALDNILTDESWEPVEHYSIDVRDAPIAEFTDRQKHIATEHCGHVNQINLEEYIEHDGFKALDRCVNNLMQEQVIEEILHSGLRGRGGGGFQTGQKWSMVRQAKADQKYVICNGDEGDPGAFMDRVILESHPYRVIEGVAIATYAVGARESYFYIRAEYPLAVRRVREALRRCEEHGFLGDDILGSGFDLRIQIMEGAGAFVCGEETALMASIEGKRGMPRLRPPYPAERGLWGKPTLVNNVETYSLVPWIIRNSAFAFASLGTETSKGTKVFALAGKIVRGGLIEVPMGITIREIVEEIGGGIADGKRFKAVQIGGPSGGCVPANLAHTPVDYEALTSVDAIMGSGGMVVLDDSDCMVDIARYFLEFTQDQSCGKCTFCRIGTRRMLDILTRFCEGKGRKGELEELEKLCLMVKNGSLCGLGKTAPNPVLSTLKYFREEYEAHLEKRCPAGNCKALITYSVTDDCIGCTLCAQHCPTEAIAMTPYQKHEIDTDKCVRCGTCKEVCTVDAIKVE